tara:strand:+ start:838 stop:945 length:108 start_codon:yes stop_codon:yes gene_type:complete
MLKGEEGEANNKNKMDDKTSCSLLQGFLDEAGRPR